MNGQCDLQLPDCGQCLKRGQQCPGYRRETIFLNQNATYSTALSRSNSKTPLPTTTANQSKSRRRGSAQERRGQDNAPAKTITYKEPRLQAQVHHQYAFRDLYIADFLSIYLTRTSSSATTPASWLQIVINVPTPGEALCFAISALSLAVVGRARGNLALSVEGARKYGKALWELQKALWDDHLKFQDQTLAACITLVLYEIYECPAMNLTGWITHAQGMSRLVEARGPKMHRSPLAHAMYKEYCSLTMVENLAMRKASFVHEPRWSTEPWEGITKTADQRLYNLGSEVSRILEKADASKLIPDPQQLLKEKITLIAQCHDLVERFDVWYEELEAEMPSPRFWPRFSNVMRPVDKANNERVFPLSFEFANLQTAKTMLDYWTLLILLYSTILITYRTLAGSSGTFESVHKPEHPADSQRAKAKIHPDRSRLPVLTDKYKPHNLFVLANNIAQSMEYMLSKGTGVLGSSWAFFPLKAAIQCYRYRPGRELQWLQETIETVSTEERSRLGPVYAMANWSKTSKAKND